MNDMIRFEPSIRLNVISSENMLYFLLRALFKKFCKRDFCDEVRDFKIPEP